jgi:hypothetical protein
MGQVQIASVRAEELVEVWLALGRAGFTVTHSTTDDPGDGQVAHCLRGGRVLELGVSRGRDPEEVLLAIAHPPYSARPWRWLGDIGFFNDLTAVLDEFRFRD